MRIWNINEPDKIIEYLEERTKTVQRILGGRKQVSTKKRILNEVVPWTEYDPPLTVEDKIALLDGAVSKREYLVLRALYLKFYNKLSKYQRKWKGKKSFYVICYLLAHAEMIDVDNKLELTEFGEAYMLSGRGYRNEPRTPNP